MKNLQELPVRLQPVPNPKDWLGKWHEAIVHARDNSVVVNLLVTRQCNFSCDHCMYRAGPHLPGRYMSFEDLSAIAGFVTKLTDAGIGVDLNFVGGEPTLNLKEFSRCLFQMRHLLSSNSFVNWDMTTNGWWLRSWSTTLKFATAISDAGLMGEMAIRISESAFHKRFRGKDAEMVQLIQRVGGHELINQMYAIWDAREREAGTTPQEIECPGCGHTQMSTNMECEDCGRWNQEAEDEISDNLPGSREREMKRFLLESLFGETDRRNSMASVDSQGSYGMVPVGRAFDLQIGTGGGSCHKFKDIKFTFEPGAVLHDPCCNGGAVPLGHADDGWLLFMRRISFMDALHQAFPHNDDAAAGERCRNCPTYGAKWLKKPQPRRDLNMAAAAAAVPEDSEDLEEFITNLGENGTK